MTSTPQGPDPVATQDRPDGAPRAHVGWIVVGSLTIGLVLGLVLVAAPFIEPEERDVTGALLLGFAVGWATLAVLTRRFSDQPQRWAAAPAAFMGVGGVLLIGFGSTVHDVLDWVWPPALLSLVMWMFVSAHRQLRSRSRRLLLYPVFAVLAIASVGGGYETVLEAVDAHTYAMPGQLINVGDHRLHLNCIGSGNPTVVLEPGAGGFSSIFGWIAPVVAKDTRVCMYDRAGRGWSEPADGPQDAAHIAADLRAALRGADVPGPYVLAGHSFGGLYVLTYAARHPDDVAGMVLVDSTAPKAPSGEVATSSDMTNRVTALLSSSARLGLARLVGYSDYGSLPPQSRNEALARGSMASTMRSTLDEYVQANASMGEAGALADFADKPLVVLTAGDGNDATWQAKQNRLANLSSNSAHRIVDGAVHASFIFEKKDAAETTRAILDVVMSVRNSTVVN
jgi:pimeloyl-ACP methyl ester carboxylesterase